MLIAVCVVFAVWNIARGKETKAVDVATLLGVPIGVTGLVVAVVALRRPVEDGGAGLAREHAKALAKRVLDSEGAVRRQLLGDDTQRINVAFVLHSAAERAAAAPSAGLTFADGPAGLPDVLDYYRATRPRRLVVTGAAGAGKTVLALELMQALIEGRSEGDPVPVRVPLAHWDTAQPLKALLVRRLIDAYGLRAKAAAGLVAHGMVLPVLDGLDEMDPLHADGTPDPEAPRARAALEALNAYQSGREAGPLVLTCRTGHYDALAPVSRLIDAARIAIAPIDTRNAVTYLRARALDRPRWQPLTDHLEAQPTGPLATTLSTPWRLCLTATVYHRDGNPSELLHHTNGHDLDQHLLARYLPAATTNTHNPRGYRPEDVHRWLHHLTKHLTGTTTRAPATDLTLHHLWPLAGTTRTRITDLLLTAFPITAFLAVLSLGFLGPTTVYDLVLCLTFGAFVVAITFRPTPKPKRLRVSATWETLRYGFKTRFWAGFKIWFVVGFAVGFTFRVTTYNAIEIRNLTSPAITPGLVYGITLGIGTGLIGGFVRGLAGEFADGFKAWFKGWFAGGFIANLVFGLDVFGFAERFGFEDGFGIISALGLGSGLALALGVVGGLAGGFMRGLRAEPTTVANPQKIIRDDIIYGLSIGPLAGLLSGLLSGLMSSPVDGFMVGSMVGIAVGLASGLAGATRRYGVFLLCSRGKLPFRLGVFLNWAVTAGLLRYNGPSYQFRHRELQQWLNQHPRP
ncbi:NACHT domain-containing protein [Streptomyces sp. NPDC015144]|uniref:NACHT domain-containing protein n=1 Tax=Streptomyces sp. NPDC015144 TaxID=3364944 RepID=UPI0036F9E7C7